MVVNSSEVLEPPVVHHLDAVDYLHVECYAVTEHSRVLYDRVRVYVVLMALLLSQPAMVIVAAKVVQLVHIERISLV